MFPAKWYESVLVLRSAGRDSVDGGHAAHYTGCAVWEMRAFTAATTQKEAAMTRPAIWILSTISGGILFVALVSMLTIATGYEATSSCVGRGCTPQLQEGGFHIGRVLLYVLAVVGVAIAIGAPAWIASPILAARRGASSKIPILTLASLSTALLLLTGAAALFSPVLATPRMCISVGSSVWCGTDAQAHLMAALSLAFGPVLVSGIVGFPAWVMALVRTARVRRWGWFVAILLLSPVATLVYGVFGPEQERPRASDVNPPTHGQPATA